eukprot:TRINITY_DN347_c0_g1_i1.p1 TRINITY_DN347_c0_g1~~TRINITY_DN347_c0_g1_i1.p1  ORF type:complete len:896 (+),score=444.59 TRINITY_DN347_c0_g1_i1:103-2790(+)
MAKKEKSKKRLDKYYHLAKEQGYRSRAAFKLMQLERKFNFLSSSRVLIDLCAAPGGWLQVASKMMPVSSVIVGVDLAPIKPIKNCILLKEDITTQKCRDAIKKSLTTWKADVVLHDGAPNVGTAWLQDAYSQAELVLSAFKLAVEFLAPGGIFLTKVFRSADYNALLWVFGHFFSSVEATKPQASRHSSAEIFVYCKNFSSKIAAGGLSAVDPKLLDPKFVFKQVEQPVSVTNIFKNEQKRQRGGYSDDAGALLYKACEASTFIASDEPIQLLAVNYQILFKTPQSQVLSNHPITTSDIRACCEDLRVLTKKDFKKLLKWRLLIREAYPDIYKKNTNLEKEKKKKDGESDEENKDDEENENDDDDSDEKLDARMTELERKLKRQKKKSAKKRSKQQERLALKMISVSQEDTNDIIQNPDSVGLFDITNSEMRHANKKEMHDLISQAHPNLLAEEQEEEEEYNSLSNRAKAEREFLLEMNAEISTEDVKNGGGEVQEYDSVLNTMLDKMYERYVEIRGSRAEKKRKKIREFGNLYDEPKHIPNLTSDPFEDEIEDEIEVDYDNDENLDLIDRINPLLVNNFEEQKVTESSKRAEMWFSQQLFDDILTNEKDIPLISQPSNQNKTKIDTKQDLRKLDNKELNSELDKKFGPKQNRQKIENSNNNNNNNESKKDKNLNDEFEVVPKKIIESDEEEEYDSEEREQLLKLGHIAVNNSFTKLIDNSYNRYTYNDFDTAPSWFRDDEAKHMLPNLPDLPQEVNQQIADRFKGVNVRTITKVAEAKARKKRRMMRRLEKINARANVISDSTEMNEKQKVREMQKLYKGHLNKMKPRSVYVVRKKFQGNSRINTSKVAAKKSKGNARGPTKVKIVDKRMKKDLRAARANKNKAGKGKRFSRRK